MSNRLRINNELYDVPTSWNDLSLTQLYQAHHVLFMMDHSLLEPGEKLTFVKMELLKIITGLTDVFFQELEKDVRVEESPEDTFVLELQHLLKLVDFFFEEVDTGSAPSLGLTRNPYPMLGQGKEKVFGPHDGLEGITIYEMSYLFRTHEEYIETKDEAELDKLISILFRRPKKRTPENVNSSYEGDIRLPFNKHEYTIDRRASFIKNLPLRTKKLILLFFESCRQSIVKTYPAVFTQSTSTEKKSGIDYSWAGVLFDLAGSLPNLEIVKNMAHEEVLLFKNKENEEIHRRNRKLATSNR